jgi:multidrug resistance efflux pump
VVHVGAGTGWCEGQRIPVSIHIDGVGPDEVLSAGMTATVQIEPRPRSAGTSDFK